MRSLAPFTFGLLVKNTNRQRKETLVEIKKEKDSVEIVNTTVGIIHELSLLKDNPLPFYIYLYSLFFFNFTFNHLQSQLI